MGLKKGASLKQHFTVVDLFCGCGGITEGLKRSNFKVIAAVDNDPVACRTYRANHPYVELYDRDIVKVDPHDIYHNDLDRKNLDLLVVCAPCQPFSTQNRLKKDDDNRYELILQASRFAEVLQPRVIFLENVPGLGKHKDILDKLKLRLRKLEYELSDPVLIDAADYAVPQRRIRCILIATLKTPPPDVPSKTTPIGKRKTVREAIYALSSLKSGERDLKDPLHQASTHQPIALERLKHIPKDGGSRCSLPEHLILDCHKTHRGHGDVYGRMKWDDVAPTLTTGCTDVSRGRFAHPEDDRAITPREAALLQSFPQNYKFVGTRTQVAQQIGNAVPVKLMSAFVPTLETAVIAARKAATV